MIRRILTRLLLTTVLLIALFGKLVDPDQAAANLEQLFHLTKSTAQIGFFLTLMFELTFICLVWLRNVPHIINFFPILFIAVWSYAYATAQDCGCFGSVLTFGQLGPVGHFILLFGMLIGCYSLSSSRSKMPIDKKWSFVGNRYRFKIIIGSVITILVALSFGLYSKANFEVKTGNERHIVDRHHIRKAIQDRSYVIIDARHPSQFSLGHIPTAINIPYNAIDFSDLTRQHSRDLHLVVYCSGPHCSNADMLADKLKRIGYKNLFVYKGGWQDWLQEATKKRND